MSNTLSSTKKQFLDLAIECNALKFGEFTLKSGRVSPYFFNAGLFSSGEHLSKLTQCYAETLHNHQAKFDVLFGPAYKGIPLASATAIQLHQNYGSDYGVAYNRKEAKQHGEGGTLVGAPLKGDVMIIDDVITAGTAIQQSLELIENAGARPCGIIVALDRQEKGQQELSAIQEIQQAYQIPVYSIANLQELIQYLELSPQLSQFKESMENYQLKYGIE